ncbi:MAG: radical SAM protein [Candidatus Omnitrophica bacterium]|nr:radical SAM protein [Candidatus Omnitrophota bacterium]MBD3268925.1 radical SAM protein [Candidatus Omnitrophota bacterium]
MPQTAYFRFFLKLLKAKLLNKDIPLIVILCVTNRCNLRCWYCYGEHPFRSDWRDFSTDELINIVDELGKMGTQILQFQGGEPLLREDLDIIIKRAKSYGMVCDMVTNATLVKKRLDFVRLLDKVCISLDGPAELNDYNRGEGVYDRVIEGIELIRKSGIPIRISSVLTSRTKKEHIDWLLDFAESKNILVNFSPSFEFLPQTESDEFSPHEIPDEYLRELFRYILLKKKERAAVQFSCRSFDVAIKWPFSYGKRQLVKEDENVDFSYPRCYHGKYVIFIDSDGSVYPCCNFWGRQKLNIFKQGLKESVSEVDRNNCECCYIPAYVDRNLFFDFNLRVWWNYIVQAIKGGV